MADLGGSFNVNEYSTPEVTDGEYKVKVSACDLKETKAGGMMVVATYEVVEGPCEGGLIFDMFNIYRDDTAGQIAKKQFAKFAAACGLDCVRNTDDLLNSVLYVTVKVEESNGYTNVRPKKYRFYQAEQQTKTNFNTSAKNNGIPF